MSAARELEEETGLRALTLSLVATEPIDGDQCRRGADGHVWHTYLDDGEHRAAGRPSTRARATSISG